jgi:predicted murein hydrolase (TIGR00659 family)
MSPFNEVWPTISRSPLFWLTFTGGIFFLASKLHAMAKFQPLLNPVLISILFVVGFLAVTRTPYPIYFDGARFIHFLLGPATVALAIPLYEQISKLKQMLWPILIALGSGSVLAVIFAVEIGRWLGASGTTILSLTPKSVTTPIAMGVAEKIGGVPALTAVLVILTGIIGAVSGKTLLDLIKIKDPSIRGFAIGLASHGIGTAAAFQMHAQAGAFSGLGMGLNGALTAFLVPVLVQLLGL